MVDKEDVLPISVVILLPLFKDNKIVALTGIREKNKQSNLFLPYFYYTNDNFNSHQSIEEASFNYIETITNLDLDKNSFKLIASRTFSSKKESIDELCLFVMYKKQVLFDSLSEFTHLEEHTWSNIKMIDHLCHEAHDESAKEFLKIYT